MALSLRPYQAAGIDFLADRGRAALFDEPGLGKTMQSLLAMRDLVPNGRLLVVSPGDAIGVWQDEVAKWLDEPVGVFAGLKPSWEEATAPGITITNYARVANVLEAEDWQGVIFDESQTLRNRKTRTLFAAVRKAFVRGGLRTAPTFALSGTPVVKAAGDLWPTLHLLDRTKYSSYWRFVSRYAVTYTDDLGHYHVEGVTNVQALWEEVGSVALRRLTRDVTPDLPPKTRQRVPLRMTPLQARAYNALMSDMIATMPEGYPDLLTPTVLARETRLRELLACPRLLGIDDDGAAVRALVEVASNSTHPFVVFTPFPSAFPFIEAALYRSGRPVYKVRGGQGEKFRDGVDLFNRAAQADASPILLASSFMAKGWSVSRSASECWNLGAGWNNMEQEQAEFRLARDGQTHPVFSKYFVHYDTHDYEYLEIIAGKKRLSDAILDRKRRK